MILSTIRRSPVNLLLHSTLAVVARERQKRELPGAFFVEALGSIGIGAPAVRQALFRAEKDGEFLARKVGRRRLYRLSPFLEAAVAAGTEKIFGPDETAAPWDGRFTLVQYAFDESRRVDRDRARDLLEVEGFAALGRGLYVHPRDRSARVLEAAARAGLRREIAVFRGTRHGDETDAEFVARLWDVRDLARRYRAFLGAFGSLAAARVGTGERAFAGRLALAIAFLDVAWDDPGLPESLLPEDWPGPLARRTAREIYEKLLPGALAHGDDCLRRVLAGDAKKETA